MAQQERVPGAQGGGKRQEEFPQGPSCGPRGEEAAGTGTGRGPGLAGAVWDHTYKQQLDYLSLGSPSPSPRSTLIRPGPEYVGSGIPVAATGGGPGSGAGTGAAGMSAPPSSSRQALCTTDFQHRQGQRRRSQAGSAADAVCVSATGNCNNGAQQLQSACNPQRCHNLEVIRVLSMVRETTAGPGGCPPFGSREAAKSLLLAARVGKPLILPPVPGQGPVAAPAQPSPSARKAVAMTEQERRAVTMEQEATSSLRQGEDGEDGGPDNQGEDGPDNKSEAMEMEGGGENNVCGVPRTRGTNPTHTTSIPAAPNLEGRIGVECRIGDEEEEEEERVQVVTAAAGATFDVLPKVAHQPARQVWGEENGKLPSEGVVQERIIPPTGCTGVGGADHDVVDKLKAAAGVGVACAAAQPLPRYHDECPDRLSSGNPAAMDGNGHSGRKRGREQQTKATAGRDAAGEAYDEDDVEEVGVSHWECIKTRITGTGKNVVDELEEAGEEAGVSYWECMKTRMTGTGTLFVDGCCKFMPLSQERTACAACGCHRSFHRRVLVMDSVPRSRPGGGGGGGNLAMDQDQPLLCACQSAMRDLAAASGKLQQQHQVLQQQGDQCLKSGAATPLANPDRATMLRSMVEALDVNAKMVVAFTAFLSLIVKQGHPKPAELTFQQRVTTKNGMLDWIRAAGFDVVEQPVRQSPVQANCKNPAAPDVDKPPPTATAEEKADPSPPAEMWSEAFSSEKEGLAGAHHSKRKRTKFSPEQRTKLCAFAQKFGYTLAGHSKSAIDEACTDIGVAPKTLRYFIHNTKQKMKQHQTDSGGPQQQ